MGIAKIDTEIESKLENLKKPEIKYDKNASIKEHSIEVQLPFLSFLFEDFKFLPITLGDQSLELIKDLSEDLLQFTNENVIIASSDLNHYEDQETTIKKDKALIDSILSLDINRFYYTLYKYNVSACGYGAIATLIYITNKLGGKAKLLYASTSGEVTGYDVPVVGYSAIAFYI